MGYKYLIMETKYTVKNIDIKRDHLSIKWGDNFKSKFHFLWLRDNCPTAIHTTAVSNTHLTLPTSDLV